MYRIDVIYADTPNRRATRMVKRAGDVLTLIPELLAEHQGCERVIVWLHDNRLFAVDCKGNRVEG